LLSNSSLLVAEADEYDRSFLQLYPKVAIITSIDADHLDIYGSHEEVKESFRAFVGRIRKDGTLVVKNKLANNGKPSFAPEFKEKFYTYSFNEQADFYAQNLKALEGGYFSFDIATPMGIVSSCTLGVPGWINVENAIAAFATAWVMGTDVQRMREALKSYSGVKRRFDVQLSTPKVTLIDDYAHHPEELKASITSVKSMFPNKKITGIFQPHLFSRTRDFAKEFAESLSLLDELILLDIYPAREKPIDGITSEIILKDVSIKSKVMSNKEHLIDLIKGKQIEVLVTMGAGDIDTMLEPIKKVLLDE
jgi:UDP-N-acetylmuramate--alanine ligase